MAVNLSPIGGVAAQFFDNNGDPLSGGKIYTYAAGTTTPSPTYTTFTGGTPHSNPIILDAAGRVPGGEIWLTDGAQYKFVIKTSTDVQIGSYDNIIGINSNFINYTNAQEIQTATAGQTVFTLTTMQYQPGTNSLSVFVDGVNQYGPGALYAYQETSSTVVTFTSGLHVGAAVKFVTSAINASSYGDAEQISYTPPYTGSAATNVEAKLAQTVSVKDFGAVGNGTADDTAAIQAAINTGKNVVGQLGDIYRTTSTVNFPATGIYWQTLDLNWATIKPDGSHNAITFNGVQFALRNVRFDAASCTGRVLYAPNIIKEFIIEDVVIQSPQGDAVVIVDAYTGRFNRLSVLNAAARSFYAYSNTLGTPINSIWVENSNFDGSSFTGNVVTFEGVAGCFIKNTSFQGNASTSTDLAIQGTANAGANGVTIEGCYWETGASINGASIAINGTASADAANIYINNCYFQTSKVDVSLGAYTDKSISVTNSTFVSVTPWSYSSWLATLGDAPRLFNIGGDKSLVAATSRASIGLRDVFYGSGTPESAVIADVGSLYMRTDTGGTSLYVKEFNNGTNTGWVPQAGWGAVPLTAGAAGIAGQMAYDSTHFYVCVATNTWRRVAISTW